MGRVFVLSVCQLSSRFREVYPWRMRQEVIEQGAGCPLVIINLQDQFLPPLRTYFCDRISLQRNYWLLSLTAQLRHRSHKGRNIVSEKPEPPHM